MKIARQPFTATVLYGLACAICFIPAVEILLVFTEGPGVFQLIVWLFLSLYGFALTRWAKTGFSSSIFPILLLFALSFTDISRVAFLAVSLAILSWIRSGICFRKPVFRSIAAEALLCFGGALLVAFFNPNTAVAWSLGFWMFFLVQSLYFVFFGRTGEPAETTGRDPFEYARKRAEDILSSG